MANARSTLKGMPDFVTTFMVAPTEVLPMSVANQQAETRAAAAAQQQKMFQMFCQQPLLLPFQRLFFP